MFPAGVAEQFAIAEAKLRAWASMDDDEEEDSNDEEPFHIGKTPSFAQSSGTEPLLSISVSLCTRCFHFTITEQTPHLLPLHLSPIYTSVHRCSDFLFPPQTPPRAVVSQERHASLSRPEMR